MLMEFKQFEQAWCECTNNNECCLQIKQICASTSVHSQLDGPIELYFTFLSHTHVTHNPTSPVRHTNVPLCISTGRCFGVMGFLTCNRSWHNACSIDRGCRRQGVWHRRRWWVTGCSVQILRNRPFLQEPLALQPPCPLGNIYTVTHNIKSQEILIGSPNKCK